MNTWNYNFYWHLQQNTTGKEWTISFGGGRILTRIVGEKLSILIEKHTGIPGFWWRSCTHWFNSPDVHISEVWAKLKLGVQNVNVKDTPVHVIPFHGFPEPAPAANWFRDGDGTRTQVLPNTGCRKPSWHLNHCAKYLTWKSTLNSWWFHVAKRHQFSKWGEELGEHGRPAYERSRCFLTHNLAQNWSSLIHRVL